MVSIMRSEQTLRLIQLYHSNYPEIARNNQDADGRNLKLQMWAEITNELNRTFETAFSVEQFKKKVQNVQCTSRQKLFSGKRNLGEAEVEYLRLFESDKISVDTLTHRAKNRRVSINSADFLMLRERHHLGEYGVNSDNIDEEVKIGVEEEGEDEEAEEGSTTGVATGAATDGGGRGRLFGGGGEGMDGSGRGRMNGEELEGRGGRMSEGAEEAMNGSSGGAINGVGEVNESSAVTAALSTIGTLFGAYGGGTESAQMDAWTQQFLLAMVNATMNGATEAAENGAGGVDDNDNRTTTMRRRERKRTLEEDWGEEEEEEKEEGRREEEKSDWGGGGPMPKKTKHGRAEEKREAVEGTESSWAGELLKIQREVLGQQREMLAQFGNSVSKVMRLASSSGAVSESAPSLPNPSPASSSASASPLPSSFASRVGTCQCSSNKNCSGALLSLERELCTRLDTTNAMLARVVELLMERLSPLGMPIG